VEDRYHQFLNADMTCAVDFSLRRRRTTSSAHINYQGAPKALLPNEKRRAGTHLTVERASKSQK
jgi:hypothetical protein